MSQIWCYPDVQLLLKHGMHLDSNRDENSICAHTVVYVTSGSCYGVCGNVCTQLIKNFYSDEGRDSNRYYCRCFRKTILVPIHGHCCIVYPHIYSFIHLSFMPLEALRYRALHHRNVCQLAHNLFSFQLSARNVRPYTKNPNIQYPFWRCVCLDKARVGMGMGGPSYHVAWNRARIQTKSSGQEKITKTSDCTDSLPIPNRITREKLKTTPTTI